MEMEAGRRTETLTKTWAEARTYVSGNGFGGVDGGDVLQRGRTLDRR